MLSTIKDKLLGGSGRGAKAKKNVLVSLLLKGASIAISLVFVPLTLSYLTPYEYGVWLTLNSILVWINYFDIGLGNGLRNKLAEAIALNDYKLGKIYVSTTFILLSIIVLIIMLLFAVANYFLDWNVILNTIDSPIANLNNTIYVVFGLCCITFVMKTVGVIYQANQQPMINDLFTFIGQALSLVYVFLLTLLTDSNFALLAIGYTAMPVVVYCIAYPITFTIKFASIRPSFANYDRSQVKSLGGMGVNFFLLQIACLVLFQSSNILITNLFSPAEVTPYNIAFRYINMCAMVFTIINSPMWTAITDAYVKKDYLWIKNSIEKMQKIFLLFVVAILFMLAINKFIFHIWIGDQVQIPFPLLSILAIYVSLDMWNKIYAAFSNGLSKIRIQIILALIQAVLYIPLAIVLGRSIGVEGVALALCIVSAIPAIGLYLFYKNTIKKLM